MDITLTSVRFLFNFLYQYVTIVSLPLRYNEQAKTQQFLEKVYVIILSSF